MKIVINYFRINHSIIINAKHVVILLDVYNTCVNFLGLDPAHMLMKRSNQSAKKLLGTNFHLGLRAKKEQRPGLGGSRQNQPTTEISTRKYLRRYIYH